MELPNVFYLYAVIEAKDIEAKDANGMCSFLVYLETFPLYNGS